MGLEAAELVQEYARLFGALRTEPSRVVRAGLISINSDSECDEKGAVHRVRSTGGASLTVKFRPNRIQDRILRTRRRFLKDGQRFNTRILKSRGVGGTTLANGLIVSSTATTQGSRSIVVSHVPKSAEFVYMMARQMLKTLPEWIRPDFTLDSVSRLEAVNPQWGITASSITNVHAEAIESLLGDRCLILFKDESARYANADEVFTATNSLVLDTPESMSLDISTSFGHDAHFYPGFMDDWNSQGERNVWEDGAKLYRRGTVSMFFPWYWDDRKQAPLPTDFTPEWLIGDLDDYERDLLSSTLIPFFGSQAEALKRIYWRRSKIVAEYRHMPIKAPVPTQVRTFEQFCREEPATVAEAFDVTGSGLVIPTSILDEIRRRDIRQPVLKGVVADGRVMARQVGSNEETVCVWKAPENITGRLVCAVDPSAGLIEDERAAWTNDRDFTYAVIFEELEDGRWEQVAEYVNQRPARVTAPDLRVLCSWLARHEEDRCPEIIVERAHGMDVLHYFLNSSYPAWKVYREIKDERAGRQAASTWGFYPSETRHVSAVGYWADMICTGRMVIRSERLRFQYGNFVQVKDKKYEARGKGQRGANSKDDGVDACCMAAYLIYYSGPRPSELDMGISDGSTFVGSGISVARPENVSAGDVREATNAILAAWSAGVKYDDLPTKTEKASGVSSRVRNPFSLDPKDWK